MTSIELFAKIILDPRYQEGILYGKPRQGHAEGTVGAHITQLVETLDKLRPLVSDEELWTLMVMINSHDTFKKWSRRDVPISDLNSHASLARDFLKEYGASEELQMMVQLHDENYALWKQFEAKGRFNAERFSQVLQIRDLELFLLFTIIDGYTPSKDTSKIRWFIEEVDKARPADPVQRPFQALAILGI